MAETIDLAYLAQRFKAVRSERKQTLQEVADEIKVSVPTLSRVERGEARNVEGPTLLALAKWLKLPADFLRGNPELPAPPSGDASSEASTPDVVELHLRADPNLDATTAKALAELFRIAYEQMASQKRTKPGG